MSRAARLQPQERTPGKPAGPPVIKTVALHAGVSVATVSRVLNDSAAVAEATREQVKRAVEALGYQTNHLARNLRTSATGLVLVTVPDLRNPFYARIVEGITSRLQQDGYLMALEDTGLAAGAGGGSLSLIGQRKVDGAICLDPATVHRSLADDLVDLPWVACCEYDRSTSVPFVGIDNEAAARDAVRHLVRRGARRIALVNYDERFLFAQQRRTGYQSALADAGIAFDPALVHTVDGLGYEQGAGALRRLMELAEPPQAVFAVSDTLAIGALRAAASLGLKVPQDLAVVGFDDIDVAAHVWPPLTTVAQPMEVLGRSAADLVIQRIREPSRPARSLTLRHELRIRSSA